MGLSPFSDRVHKCGQTWGTEAVSVCTDSVGYHSCHSAGAGPPPLPTLPLESAATRPPPLFPHNVSIVTCQVVAGRQGQGTPACWGRKGFRRHPLALVCIQEFGHYTLCSPICLSPQGHWPGCTQGECSDSTLSSLFIC